MRPDIYLARIGLSDASAERIASVEFLTDLQQAHMLSIPFEDLDIPIRKIDLDLNAFYNKVVMRKRGGFCYELNGLFQWLCTRLGFTANMVSARVFNKATKRFGPDYDHMALLVSIGAEYLVDVGFGDSFRTPMRVPDGVTEDTSGKYRVVAVEGETFELQKMELDTWIPHYKFSKEHKRLSDFKEMCDFHQNHPESHFRTRMLCTIATPGGRVTLSNNSLTITDGGVKTQFAVQDRSEFNAMLLKYFNMRVEFL